MRPPPAHEQFAAAAAPCAAAKHSDRPPPRAVPPPAGRSREHHAASVAQACTYPVLSEVRRGRNLLCATDSLLPVLSPAPPTDSGPFLPQMQQNRPLRIHPSPKNPAE